MYRRSDFRDKWRIERHAEAIRTNLGLDQLAPIDPGLLCEAVPAHVFYPEDFDDVVLVERLASVRWDGFSFCYPGDATLIVVMNPARARARQTATLLMEELAHHLLGHRPSAIWRDTHTGLLRRDYNGSQEAEAYDLGAAILLPKERIQRDVRQRAHAAEVARIHGCSEDLVTYRIKRMRLCRR